MASVEFKYASPKRKRREIEVDYVWDIEAEDWENFHSGGLLDATGDYAHFTWKKEEDFARRLLQLRGCVWAHAGGTYDLKWFMDWVVKLGHKGDIITSGSRVVVARINEATFLDSYALSQVSLKKLTADLGVRKESLGLECICGECESGEGYCRIKRSESPDIQRKIAHYLKADCFSLREGLQALQEFAKRSEIDIDLGATVGAAAWSTVHRKLNIPIIKWNESLYNQVRAGYSGGRVEVYQPECAEVWEYDLNSAYVAAIANTPMPIGEPFSVGKRDARDAWKRGNAGIYGASVTVPHGMHLPPLPFRAKERIFYPTGHFEGAWPENELRYAESLGCEVEIENAVIWEDTAYIFREWAIKMYAARAFALGGKDGGLGKFLKAFLVSLTGKFGARMEKMQIALGLHPLEITICPCVNENFGVDGKAIPNKNCACGGQCCVECEGWCGAHYKLNDDAKIWGSKKKEIPACAHPEFAAYLTGANRITHHARMNHNGGRWTVYGDTDGIFGDEKWGPERPVTDDSVLGGFLAKAHGRDWFCAAPKMYALDLDDSKRLIRAKGLSLPKDSDLALLALYSGEGSAGKMVGVKTGAREGRFFRKKESLRQLHPLVNKSTGARAYGGRILEKGERITRPPTAEEARAWKKTFTRLRPRSEFATFAL